MSKRLPCKLYGDTQHHLNLLNTRNIMRPLTYLLTFISTPLCFAGGMDHIHPVGADLVSTPGNGRVQVYTDTSSKSNMIIDDFFAEGSVMDGASMALEFSFQDIDRPDGWRISVWDSVASAANSGNDFTQNTVATIFVDFFDSNWSLNPLGSTGANSSASQIDFTNLNLNIGAGVRYIGISPVQSSTVNLNWLLLAHENPALLGNGTDHDSIGINPGGGLGNGTSYAVGTNASYQVEVVPEPATLIVLAGTLVALSKRRRR